MSLGIPTSQPIAAIIATWGSVGGPEHLRLLAGSGDRFGGIETRSITGEAYLDASAAEIAGRLLALHPTAICFGGDIPLTLVLDVAREVQLLSPSTEMLLVGDPSPERWADCARTGIRELIPLDADARQFTATVGIAIERAVRLQRHLVEQVAAVQRHSRTMVVLSPKGGSGKTTIASNLAAAMAKVAPGRVVLVDLDCQFGDVATSLGLDPERTLTELGVVQDLDASKVKLFLTHHDDGKMFVLASSGTPEEADLIDEPKAAEILRLLRAEFSYVIVDTAAGLDERSLAAILHATDLVFVASMDVTSIRNLVKEVELLDQLQLPPQSRHFILNRVDNRAGLKISEIEAALGMTATFQLANDDNVLKRLNEGRPVVLANPRSKLSKQFDKLARSFMSDDDIRRSKRRR